MERVLTQQEEQAIHEAERSLREAGLDVDHEGSNNNADLIWQYFQANPSVPVTVASIKTLVESRRNDFVWRTQAQREYDQTTSRLSETERQLVHNLMGRSRLVTDGDEGLENFSTIVSYFRNNNWPIAANSFDTVLSNLGRSGRHQYRPLRYLPAKQQDSEREAVANRVASQQPARSADEVQIPAGLAPHLHEHFRQMHRKTESAVPSTPVSADSHYKGLAESAVASISSNLDREQAAQFLSKGAAWGWELTFRQISSFINRRAQQRASMGR